MQGREASGLSSNAAATQAVPAALRRGLALVKDKRWMDALDVFTELAAPPPPTPPVPSTARATGSQSTISQEQSKEEQLGTSSNTEANATPQQAGSIEGSKAGSSTNSTSGAPSLTSILKKTLAMAMPGLGKGTARAEQTLSMAKPASPAPEPVVSAEVVAAWAGDFAKLCRLKLELPENAAADTAQGSLRPVAHLVNALRYASPQLMGSGGAPLGFSLPGLSSKLGAKAPKASTGIAAAGARVPSTAALEAAAAGEALAYLLHPMVSAEQLPKSLTDEAWSVLRAKAQAFSTVNAMQQAALAAGNAGSKVSKQQMVERAQGSKALLKLADLIGLSSIKQELLNLRDQVCHHID
jgi:hypothetical protein